jgi:Protein of unknown function (DUF3300)
MKPSDQYLAVLVSMSLLFGPMMLEGCSKPTAANTHQPDQAQSNQATTPPAQQAQQAPPTTQANPTPDQLYQLVAPIALFPDNLVALVLAASTYPDQITAANKWLSQNSSLKGDALSQAVDKQDWDNSVKGLTQFSDVLNQLATNLSWTTALGEDYFNVPQDVMNAVQVMRQRAQQAGNLKTTEQQKVTVEKTPPPAAPAAAAPAPVVVQAPPQTIIIQPAQPTVVYVPTYNPTVVYGAPVPVYPGYSTADVVATGIISFGLGIAVGAAIANNNHCCGWGYSSWGCGWHSSTVVYNRNVYVSHSATVVNRNNYYNNHVSHYNNVNRNNVNVNNVNVNNVNRNNVNSNNINRNNVNTNNRTNNFTTPTFNQNRNQPQFANTNANHLNTAQNNRQQPGAQNRGNLNQTQNRPNTTNQQRDPARGYGQQQNRGANSTAFGNYSPGGKTQTNSARGAQSLQGGHSGGARPQRTGGGRHR